MSTDTVGSMSCYLGLFWEMRIGCELVYDSKFKLEPIQKVSQIFERNGPPDNRSEKRELSVDWWQRNTEIMYNTIVMYCTVFM